MNSRLPKVIALGYYDGPTEGIVTCPNGAGSYFNLIAWDSGQDERMYAVLDVPSEEMRCLVSALKPPSAADAWLPDWKAISDASKCEIESLIQAWKRRVVDAGYLVLTRDLSGPERRQVGICSEHRGRLELCLRMDSPGDLADWQGLL